MRKTLAFILGISLFGCKPEPLPGEANAPQFVGSAEVADEEAVDPPLLAIGDRTLTLSEFDRRAELLSRTARYRLNSPAQRRRLLEMVVWAELVAIEATREGLVGGLDEQLLVADARARAILEDGARRSVNRADIEDDTVRALFDAEAGEIQRPEVRRLYTIVRPDLESAQALHTEITALLEVDLGRRIFRALAPIHSVHEETREDGFVGELRADAEADPVFLAAAFSTEEEGLVPEVQRTTRGYEIIFVDLVVDAREIPFQEFEGRIRERLHRESIAARQRALLDEARENAGVTVEADALDALTAARADEPESLTRARRYSEAWLAESPTAILSQDATGAILAELERARANPLAATGALPLDGSGETTDGSGDTEVPPR